MFKHRKAFVVALALFEALSLAPGLLAHAFAQQQVICPNRPAGDNTNNCASTKWVKANGGGGGGTPGGSSGQTQYNNAGSFGGYTMGGDCTITASTGVIICTKTNGVAFATSATTDTTNATNIASGSLALARIAGIAQNTVLGSVIAGTNAPVALTTTQLTTLCNAFTSTLSGCVPLSGGGTTNFLRADGTWVAPGGAGGPGGTNGQIQYNNASAFGGFTMSGDCTIVVGTGVITCTIPLTHLATQANNTVVGNVSGGTAAPIALSATQLTTLCNAFTATLSGCAPLSGGGTTNYLRADGTWAAPSGTTPGGTSGQIQYNNAGAFGGFTMAGDCTFSVPNITCTKTNGTAFAASATTDTTNASNISSGSLALGRIAAIANSTVLGNVSGVSAAPAALTATQLTTLCNVFTSSLPGCVSASGGGTANFLRADGSWATPTAAASCPPSWFCVSTAGFATALTNFNAAGHGVLYVDTATTVATAQSVTATSGRIVCKDQFTGISTSSTTAHALDISSFDISVDHCAFGYTGTPGTKSAGAFIHFTGTYGWFDSNTFGGDGWYDLQIDNVNAIVNINNMVTFGNTAVPAGVGGAAIRIDHGDIINISNTTTGAVSNTTFERTYDVLGFAGSITINNGQFLQALDGVTIAPQSGQAAYLYMNNTYLDNCGTVCLQLIPTIGTIGDVRITTSWFGTANPAGGGAINIDGSSGNIGPIVVEASNIFSYSANPANCVNIANATQAGEIRFIGNTIGSNCTASAFSMNGGTGNRLSLINNGFNNSSGNAVTLVPTMTQPPIIQGNRFNSRTTSFGGNSTTYIVNNVP